MPTFGEQVLDLIDEIDNKHEKHERFIRRSLLRALKNLRARSFSFMEKRATFDSIPEAPGYVSSINGSLPVGIQMIRYIADAETGMQAIEKDIGFTKIYQKRPYTAVGTYSIPFYWFWSNDVTEREAEIDSTTTPPQVITEIRGPGIEVAPTAASVRTFEIYYKADPARDETTGNEIAWEGQSDAAINDWLRLGEPALRCRVLRDYYTTMSKDAEAAQLMQAEYVSSMSDLQSLSGVKQQNVQARHYF